MTRGKSLPGHSLAELLDRASSRLSAAGIDQARADAELLAIYCFKKQEGRQLSRGRLQALALAGLLELSPDFVAYYEQLLDQRASRVPLQHITGVAYFRSLELKVGPGVFVPRPETELLVSYALDYVDRALAAGAEQQLRVIDLCTGSAAIALSLKTERPHLEVYAVEVSELAHAWARENLAASGVHLILGDARQVSPEQEATFDLVTCNPPYIPTAARPSEPEVRDHDPHLALYGGSPDGLAIPAAMVGAAYRLLKPGGMLILEHAHTQRQALSSIIQGQGFVQLKTRDDLLGRARHISALKA